MLWVRKAADAMGAQVTDTTTMARRVRARALTTVLAALTAALIAASPASANHTLDLTVTKTAGGTVSSGADGEINCGTDCTGTYRHTQICESEPGQEHVCWDNWESASLTATPAPGYRFTGWSGACSGTGTCDLEMTVDRAVHATFANTAPSVTITAPASLAWTRSQVHVRGTFSDDSAIAGFPVVSLWQRDSLGFMHETDSVQVSSTMDVSQLFTPSSQYPDGPQAGMVRIRACDHAGACTNADRFFGIDRVQPTITPENDGPSGTVGPGQQVLNFQVSDATSGLLSGPTCRIDGTPFNCSTRTSTGAFILGWTYSTSGAHTWSIDVSDKAGNVAQFVRTFTVDADPPQTFISSGPADGSSSTDTTATFAFNSSPASGNTFRCRIYSVASVTPTFGDCSGPGTTHTTSGLPPGTYRFEVAARDAVGNTDPTPAARTFTVTAPSTPSTGETGGSGSTGGSGETSTAGSTIATTTTTATTTTATTTTGTQAPGQAAPAPKSKPGKCAKLKGKKRSACIRKQCGRYKKKKDKKSVKKYKDCVKKVTRK